MKTKSDFILIGVLAGIVAILDYIGVVALPFGVFSVSSFYIGGAFFTAFALWFKKDGLIAIYVGLLIGAIISGTFTVFAFLLALGNVLGAMSIMLGFMLIKLDYNLKKSLDYLAFLGFVVISQLISSCWTLGGFVLFGLLPPEAFQTAMIGWIVGGIIVNIVIGIPLLKFFTPVISRSGLLKK